MIKGTKTNQILSKLRKICLQIFPQSWPYRKIAKQLTVRSLWLNLLPLRLKSTLHWLIAHRTRGSYKFNRSIQTHMMMSRYLQLEHYQKALINQFVERHIASSKVVELIQNRSLRSPMERKKTFVRKPVKFIPQPTLNYFKMYLSVETV